MSALTECIDSLQTKLERHKTTGLKETPTRTIFVDPLLKALGWDVGEWDDVEQEYSTRAGRCDYALKLNAKPVLFVEAKPLGDSLEDAVAQIISYAAVEGVEWCVLTNGIEYRVYSTREKGAAAEKLLFRVSIDSSGNGGIPNQQVANQLSCFSKGSMENNSLDNLAEEIFTKTKVQRVLDKILQDPPASITRLVRAEVDVELPPAQLKKIIKQLWEARESRAQSVREPKPDAEPKRLPRGVPQRLRDRPATDTIVVPAHEDGFKEVFLGENRWYAIRIHPNMIPKIKHVAVYRKAPIGAITHLAEIRDIQPWENSGKYVLNFAGPAQEIKHLRIAPQSPRYTTFAKLQSAKTYEDVFST